MSHLSEVIDPGNFSRLHTLATTFEIMPSVFTQSLTTTTESARWSSYSQNRNVLRKIESFRDLGANWDSYNAAPIAIHNIREASSFVRTLDRLDFQVFFVAPGPDGEVMVELKNGNKSIEFFFEDDEFTFAQFSGNDLIEEGDVNEGNLHAILSWINE